MSEGVQFLAARSRKRPHSQMSQTSSATPGQSPWPPSSIPSSSAPHQNRPLQLPTRYPGDGFDFRRPVMSSPPSSTGVIDLTNEPDSPPQPRPQQQQQRQQQSHPHHARLPRFGRNIMADVVDLVEDEDEDEDEDDVQEIEQGDLEVPPSSSPEVEFVGATTRAPNAPPIGSEGSQLWRMLQRNPIASFVMSTEALRRPIPWANGFFRRPPQEVDSFLIGGNPGDLEIEYPVSTATADRGPPAETYKAPSPAPEGFTRNAKEDEVVVCPNCDEELGTGDETKQQIWVVKRCGHVYCGECAKHRSLSKAKKVSQRTKPFSKCKADNCGLPVSAPKSMFQVYM